ncbi:MAG: hypothetical protein L3J32_11125 [Rhizobiaceae bacterium]|nr:hypothetical protein [Rhizobiaceae bacterium]
MTTITASAGLASDHNAKPKLQAHGQSIDMFITGANKKPLRPDNLTPYAANKSECVLCYHRQMLKKFESSGSLGATQPFPGD